MLNVTKTFTFEMAHAIYNYEVPCSNIHGHSYILHVKVKSAKEKDSNLISPGFIIDFKKLKEILESM